MYIYKLVEIISYSNAHTYMIKGQIYKLVEIISYSNKSYEAQCEEKSTN